jgi:protein-S-isoprenylcysteine O-methyltransferase Ste14
VGEGREAERVLDAIGEILPSALGVAISPIPIIAVILMLFTPQARTNGPAFLLGWIVGLGVVSAVVYSVADSADVATDSDASSSLGWGKIVLGALLLLLALKQWRGRPKPGAEADMPAWMSAIDTFTPVKAVGLGFLLSAVNPKNLIFTAAAAASVAQAGLTGGDAAIVLAVFVLLASVSIAGPVFYSLLGGDTAAESLTHLKTWLGVHNAAVMTVLLTVIGAKILGDGLGLA